MKAVKDDGLYLRHMRDAIADIERYAATGRDAFFADRMCQDAVIRKIEVLGEAAKRLSDATKARRPDIQWREIAGRASASVLRRHWERSAVSGR